MNSQSDLIRPDVRSGKLCKKIVLLVSEDWFALSHFRPLIRALLDIAQSVIVVTRSSGRLSEIEALGARTVLFDFGRSANSPTAILRQSWQLRRILRRENPDVVHMVAIKPIVLGGLALTGITSSRLVLHVTGQGFAGISRTWKVRSLNFLIMRLLGRMLRSASSYLLVENSEDLAVLRKHAADPGNRVSVLGGAGVDPQEFPAQLPPSNAVPVVAHVGRMIHSKGVDLLLQAYDRLRHQGVQVALDLYGSSDRDNPAVVAPDVIERWCKASGARWHGHVTDVVSIWRQTDIFVLASRGGEGLPRSLLEAAACARPLIVTAVPGNQDLVRDGIEGHVVPPNDVSALTSALARLAGDRELRRRMGEAARRRLLSGYTEAHVGAAVISAYETMFRQRLPSILPCPWLMQADRPKV